MIIYLSQEIQWFFMIGILYGIYPPLSQITPPYILKQATSRKLKSWTNVAMWLTNALSVKANTLRLVVNAVI